MPRQSRGARRAALTLITALIAVFAAAVAAWADEPMRLEEQITDRVDALGDRRNEAQAALDTLRDETKLELFVVFVDSFDGVPAQQWAEQTAVRSDLGDRDGLLAVATGDRAYAYNVDQNFPLTDDQLADVAATAIEPALSDNDWAGAVIGAADGYRAAAAGEPIPKPEIIPGEPDPGEAARSGANSGISAFAVLCPLILLAAAGLGIFFWWRSRQAKPAQQPIGVDPNDPFAGTSTQDLSDRANSHLLELDDALRTSERELSMATTQYGAEATAQFTAAVQTARQEVGEAFRLRMLLEDAPTDGTADEAGRRRLLADIIGLSESADARLDAESDAFDELRELETRLEQSITTLSQRRSATEEHVPAAQVELETMQSAYVGQTLTAVAANPQQATERLRFASSALQKATDDAAAGRRSAAALAVRAAEQALDQADTLLTSVTKVSADLAAARTAVRELLVEVEADLAAGRAARESGGAPAEVTASLAAAVAGGEQAIAMARAALEAPTMDPLATARTLQEADAALDRSLADVRGAVERAERARAMLDQAILAARAEISAATDFVNTRRGAVRERARTLLAEAQRHLDRAVALSADDPVEALAEAQQADHLAEQASRAAHSDVDQWSAPGGFAGTGDAALGGLAGAILGGILVGGHRHGGGYGGGFGGGGFGGGFGGGGFRGGGGSFGGHSPGGFGGTGSAGRRGGGGRF